MVLPLKQIGTSPTLLLNEQLRMMEQRGQPVCKLGFGQSPFPPIPAAVEALREHARTRNYTPVQGIMALRECVAAFHRQCDNLEIKPQDVIIAPGSKVLIYCILAAFEHAQVFLPSPTWVSYMPQARMLGHRVVSIPSTFEQRWLLTADALADALATQEARGAPSILILTSPGNPTGLSYDAEHLKQIAEVCAHYGVYVISDEIYGLLHHEGGHVSLAQFYPEGTIVTGGLSKWAGAGGWRLGTALLPEALHHKNILKPAIMGVASEVYSCASTPIQFAAQAAYEWSQATQEYVEAVRKIFACVGQWSAERLQSAGVQLHRPDGGFYHFVDFMPLRSALHARHITTSQALCAALLRDTGVALLPADAFGVDKSYLSARLAYVDFDGADALAAVRELGDAPIPQEWLQTYFLRTARGIDALCDWLAQ